MHHPLFELCGSVVTPGSVSCLAETEESCLCFAHCNGNEPLQRLCRKVKHFWNISLTIEEELGWRWLAGCFIQEQTPLLSLFAS